MILPIMARLRIQQDGLQVLTFGPCPVCDVRRESTVRRVTRELMCADFDRWSAHLDHHETNTGDLMAQSYTNPVARRRMESGLCPECGMHPGTHAGLGGGGCSLTDNGVAERIAQYRREQAEEK